MLAVLAPGQGSQKPGFLAPWLDLPGADARLRGWSKLADVDLIRLGSDADAEEIRDTAKTQPLLVAAALLAGEQLDLGPVSDDVLVSAESAGMTDDVLVSAESAFMIVLAGHSVGEIGAAALAGVLSPETAITFAAVRGREMAAACALEPTSMVALLGGDPAEVLAAIEAAGLYAANRNGAGQIVVAGSTEALAAFTANPPARTRLIPLKVAGAFHTPYMAPAEAALSALASGITPADPDRILLSNLDGAGIDDGTAMLARLVNQVTAPVRWDLCLRTLADLQITAVIELPPAGTLAGLVKRELKGVEVVTVNTPDDLAAARDLISRHGPGHPHAPNGGQQ